MILLPAVVVPFIFGHVLILTFMGTDRHPSKGLYLTLAGVAGYGSVSFLYFAWRSFGGTASWHYAAAETLLAFSLLFLYRKRFPEFCSPAKAKPSSPMRFAAWGGAISIILSVALLAAALPHGTLDAWAIWNLHARFLHRATGLWWEGYAELHPLTHPDYPLLLPSLIARFWAWSGESPVAPGLACVLTAGALMGLAAGFVQAAGSRLAACFIPLVVMVPPMSMQAAARIADLPLAAYMLGTLGLLSTAISTRENQNGAFAASGFLAGCAAWTKNEGNMFLVVTASALVIFLFRDIGGKRAFRRLALFVAGAVPGIAALAAFRLLVPVGNDLVSAATNARTVSQIFDLDRQIQIFSAFISEWTRFGWGISWIVVLLWFIRPSEPRGTNLAIWIILVMLAGYFAAYLVSPHDLSWHLGTSLSRLFCQIWPSFAVMAFIRHGRRTDSTASPDML